MTRILSAKTLSRGTSTRNLLKPRDHMNPVTRAYLEAQISRVRQDRPGTGGPGAYRPRASGMGLGPALYDLSKGPLPLCLPVKT